MQGSYRPFERIANALGYAAVGFLIGLGSMLVLATPWFWFGAYLGLVDDGCGGWFFLLPADIAVLSGLVLGWHRPPENSPRRTLRGARGPAR